MKGAVGFIQRSPPLAIADAMVQPQDVKPASSASEVKRPNVQLPAEVAADIPTQSEKEQAVCNAMQVQKSDKCRQQA